MARFGAREVLSLLLPIALSDCSFPEDRLETEKLFCREKGQEGSFGAPLGEGNGVAKDFSIEESTHNEPESSTGYLQYGYETLRL